jgi:hypothetical protein
MSTTVLNRNTGTIARTNCNAAELLWDEEMASTFRQIVGQAIGRDCLCRGDERPCYLANPGSVDPDGYLQSHVVVEDDPFIKVLAGLELLDEDQLRQLLDQIEEERAAKTATA